MEHKATICQHLGSGLTVIWHHWQVLVKLQDYNVSPLFPNGEKKKSLENTKDIKLCYIIYWHIYKYYSQLLYVKQLMILDIEFG